ncbi:hypothetical protein WME75_18360 [Sorangium sp. So ce1014]|uniref:hypothetical protein n=1 Tax=Sorangium sp. So ce1014 TaxID=3133326 RepID=UPI003F64720F
MFFFKNSHEAPRLSRLHTGHNFVVGGRMAPREAHFAFGVGPMTPACAMLGREPDNAVMVFVPSERW